MNAADFENKLHEILAKTFPFCVLPNVRLFRPSYAAKRSYGFELDNIIHISFEGSDYLIVLEAKNQVITEIDNKWQVAYGDKMKCARLQVQEHIATLREYLEPLSKNIDLRFLGLVVSSVEGTPSKMIRVDESEDYYCCHYADLPQILSERFNLRKKPDRAVPEVYRLSQSNFLELFRLGVPHNLLGHPEIPSAIEYVERCRRSLDETIYLHFSPTPERWAINGSAGMGKSVLLGYGACVLSCGFELDCSNGKPILINAEERLLRMKFDHTTGGIGVFAMTLKQLENLQAWFEHFCDLFRKLDVEDRLRFRRPEFRLCRTMVELERGSWAAVILDEAHDINENASKRLAFRHKSDGFYLMVACDRHQRLRLAGDDARIIEGLDFSSKTKRLRQIYRNPAPIYLASLALMFRWFAQTGPKIYPTREELENAFGFDVDNQELVTTLSVTNDAHPSNTWSHTVASFPSAAAAYRCLAQSKLGKREVLWVRFSGESEEFDYESLSLFTFTTFAPKRQNISLTNTSRVKTFQWS